MAMTSKFSDKTSSSSFYEVALFLWSSLVTGPILYRIDPKSANRKKKPSEFCRISGGCGELGIPNLAGTSLINVTECCKMPGLQLFPFLSY